MDPLVALLDALNGLTTVAQSFANWQAVLPNLVALGFMQFLGELGHSIYTIMGGFFRGANLVTRLPPAWTTENPLVLTLWEGTRWLANALLALTLAGSLWEHARNPEGKHAALLPLHAVERVCYGALAVNGSLLLARIVLGLADAIYAWVASVPLLQLLPGWAAAGAADRRTAEGIGLLLYGIAGVFLFLHALAGAFFFCTLLVLMPLAFWAMTMPFASLQHWFLVWLQGVGGALGAKLALGIMLRLAVSFLESGLVGESWPDVSGAVMALLLGGAGLLVALKLASMGHAGVQMFHPFATASRVGSAARSAGAATWSAVAVPFMGTAAAPAAAAVAATTPAPAGTSCPAGAGRGVVRRTRSAPWDRSLGTPSRPCSRSSRCPRP
jgi:hypothetical protein